jgi:hypothetical protein
LRTDEGDVLAFLPGAGEIRRVDTLLAQRLDRGVVVTPLYGMLERDAHDRALFPDRDGRRKVVLSTSIAETSLTIEGIRVVVDSGLSRAPRFSPRTGMTRLQLIRVSNHRPTAPRALGSKAPGSVIVSGRNTGTTRLLEQSPPRFCTPTGPAKLDSRGCCHRTLGTRGGDAARRGVRPA